MNEKTDKSETRGGISRFNLHGKKSRLGETGIILALRLAAYAILLCGAIVMGTIAYNGSGAVFQNTFPFVNVAFFTEAPETLHVFEYGGTTRELGDRAYRQFVSSLPETAPKPQNEESYVYAAGGIFPCIAGTFLLVVGSMAIAFFLGISGAIYLSEYAKPGAFVRAVRVAILNLAGVPSIVFGLFGFGLFVIFFGWNVSLLAGWCTLALMALPIIITAGEESLRAVPKGLRDASYALGASTRQTIFRVVLPSALPGILTSSILGIARVAGETAPIMFTAAYIVRDKLPWEVDRVSDFFLQGVMALPYHIYVVSTKIPQNEYTARVQYGSTFVFLILVALIAGSAVLIRDRLRRAEKL